MPTIAFIGLGRIGFPIGLHIANPDRRPGQSVQPGGQTERLIAFDPALDGNQKDELQSHGYVVVNELSEVADAAPDFVFTVLPNSDVVESVYNILQTSLKPGTVCVDMSTGYPESSAKLAETLATSDLHLVEAPICGGAVPGAYAGQLVLAVSGASDHVEAVRPLLERTATTLLVMPEGVQAQALKLLTNYVVMGTHAMASELLSLGGRFGLDTDQVLGLLSQCAAGRLMSFPTLAGTLFNEEENPYFRTELAAKDLRYAARVAAERKAPFLIGDAIHEYYLLSELVRGGDKEALASIWKMFQGMR